MPAWETALAVVTTITQVTMTLSPVPDLAKVHKAKSTGEMVVFPLVAMVLNNNMWTMYGYMTSSWFPLFATSLFGEIVSTGYTLVYFWWSPNRRYVLRTVAIGAVFFVLTTAYVVLGTAGATGQSVDQVATVHGWIAVIINVFMYASPLEKLRTVLITKSSASIPINLSIMIFVNCCLWVATAVVDHDTFVLMPNIIGVILTAFQIVLYFIYRPHKTAQSLIAKDEPLVIAVESSRVVAPAEPASPSVFSALRSPLAPLQG